MEAKPAAGARTFGSNHRLLWVGPLTLSHLQVTKGPKHHSHEGDEHLPAGHYHSHGTLPAMRVHNIKLVRIGLKADGEENSYPAVAMRLRYTWPTKLVEAAHYPHGTQI